MLLSRAYGRTVPLRVHASPHSSFLGFLEDGISAGNYQPLSSLTERAKDTKISYGNLHSLGSYKIIAPEIIRKNKQARTGSSP